MQDILNIKVTSVSRRMAVAAAATIPLVLGWLAICMQFGNLLVESASVLDPRAPEIARAAFALAPEDPLALHFRAQTSNDQEAAVRDLERAVEAAPSEFRWRVSLGRAYEQAGHPERAEHQFKTAVDLAPNYAFTRWHLGNFYLRQGREAEAIENLKRATIGHYSFRAQVFSLTWEYFGGDTQPVETAVADDPETLAYLANFFAQRGKGHAALRIWNRLGPDDQKTYSAIGSLISQELYGKGNFAEALEMARVLGNTDAVAERISNGSFEDPLMEGQKARFSWEIVPDASRVEIMPDVRLKRSGGRSLRLAFRGTIKNDFANAFQAVVIEPNKGYTLSFFYRTEGLRSPVRPMLQIVNANDNAVLASSEMFLADLSEWKRVDIPFQTLANTTAISLRTFRPACGEHCAIAGDLWYDDFELSPRSLQR